MAKFIHSFISFYLTKKFRNLSAVSNNGIFKYAEILHFSLTILLTYILLYGCQGENNSCHTATFVLLICNSLYNYHCIMLASFNYSTFRFGFEYYQRMGLEESLRSLVHYANLYMNEFINFTLWCIIMLVLFYRVSSTS